jgi:hypothetical protein
MTSVINGFGYNGGNQLRVDFRNLTTRVDTLTTTLNSLKDLFITLHPDKADVINATFSSGGATSQQPSQQQSQQQQQQQQQQPSSRTPAQQEALNRVRP